MLRTKYSRFSGKREVPRTFLPLVMINMMPAINSHLAAPLRQLSSVLNIDVKLRKKIEAEVYLYM